MAGQKGANRTYTDEELLEHLRTIERTTGHPATEKLLASLGPPSAGTFKNRFGSIVEARRLAGCSPSQRRTLTPDDLLADLREVCDAMDGIPGRLEFARRKGYSSKRFDDLFGRGGWAHALRCVGRDPRRTRFEAEELLREIRRLTESALPGKPSGVAPSHSDVQKWSGYSTTPFDRCFGSVDAAVRAAGLTPAPRMRRDMRQRLVAFARRFAERNGFPPNTSDFEAARLWPTAITRHFGSIARLLLEAGLDPNDSAGRLMAARGRDGLFYDTRGERAVADLLFEAMLRGRIADYIPHQTISSQRRWEVDFVVVLNDGNAVFVEFDGYDPARRLFPFDRANARTEALRERGLPLWLVVPKGPTHEYEPYYGERLVLGELEARLEAQRQRATSRPDCVEPLPRSGEPELTSCVSVVWDVNDCRGEARPVDTHEPTVSLPDVAESEGIALAHAAFLHRRGELTHVGWAKLGDGSWEPRFREGEVRSDIRRALAAAGAHRTYLPAPEVAAALGISHTALIRHVRAGTIQADYERSGRKIVYFDASRLDELRQALGLLPEVPDGHMDARELGNRAGVTITTINGLVANRFLTPAGAALIRGRRRHYFAEADVERVRERFGEESIPPGMLTTADLAREAGVSRTTILRLLHDGRIAPAHSMLVKGTPTHLFPAGCVQDVRSAAARASRKA